MKKIILLFFLLINPGNAFHDTDVAEKDIAMLGGVYTQMIVYSQMCTDDQYYSQVINRLNESPRFLRYTQEMEHLSERQQLAWERGDLGATMNRMEHTIDNLSNIVVNTTVSRGRIEDADMAEESVNLSKSQVLQQAATAMLAQANQSMQSVLDLLR